MADFRRYVRSHHCGDLSASSIGQEVTLCGWASRRRDHGGLIFVDLRDRYGLTQVVFDPALPVPKGGGSDGKEAHSIASQIRSEYVIWCKGTVRARPDGMKNPNLDTGEIEVACTDLEILSESKTPPFPISEDAQVSESIRLKYRYLDLRRTELQRNLWIRHRAIAAAREHLNQNGFIEVETPILYKSTPEGARDFIVPSRMNPGNFFALPQSPQTLKQLLMISGMDRYYQIARCFRDEDLRADRQPEFSQIDIEASFIDEEVLFPMIESMMKKVWKEVLGVEISIPFKRLAYSEAMNRFGVDRPDVRFGLELRDLSPIFEKSDFQVFKKALSSGSVRGIVVSGEAENFSRKDFDDLVIELKPYGAKGLLWMKIQAGGEIQSPAAKFLSEVEKKRVISELELKEGDLVLCVADEKNRVVYQSLGALRLKLAERLGVLERANSKPGAEKYAFLWVTGFPLLEYDEQEGRYFSCHHPFTAPIREHVDDFIEGSQLERIQASAYDLVLNGAEIAGGSIRIHRTDVQKAMFRNLGLTEDEAKEKFGFFLEALQYGTPPHGGIAFGLERLSAILAGTDAIRDVMAFPKTQKGHCLMSDCPSGVDPEQLTEAGISLIKRKSKS